MELEAPGGIHFKDTRLIILRIPVEKTGPPTTPTLSFG